MVQVGDKIVVRHSKWLEINGNSSLINKKGIVTKIVSTEGKAIGVYADIKIARKTKNYYLPLKSIESQDYINKIRTLSVLKTTIL